ncbi:hypothetical protein SDC9_202265 [bioreactor metagenome]|uniref:Uncharacterized protein n=1 Tax=bioreactor metagenome TaxID=1076179 RepID=A0A645J273_9ZZZZ
MSHDDMGSTFHETAGMEIEVDLIFGSNNCLYHFLIGLCHIGQVTFQRFQFG